jgi:hypothetical protein
MKNMRTLLVGFSLFGVVFVVFISPTSTAASPVIQEVLYDGPGTDAIDVFTEIFGVSGMSLEGWSLVGVNGSNGESYRTVSLDGAVVPKDGILVITTSSASSDLLVHGDFFGEVDWQNGPDAVQLVDPLGKVIYALQYGDAGVNNSGEGTPAVDVDAGWSLTRDLFGTDTNDNLTDFLASSSPTPGTGPRPVPLPGSLALFATSIFGLIAYKRKVD